MTAVKSPSEVQEILEKLKLDNGSHLSFSQGACLLEAASFIAGEPFSDHPECVSPVLGRYGRSLNDRLSDEDRQKLKPFIPRLVGTADDGQDDARQYIASNWAIRVATPRYLDKAGFTKEAAALRALAPVVDAKTLDAARTAAYEARDVTWAARAKSRESLREKVRAELVKRGLPAAAVAAADAAAAADADAAAAADAAADAAAAADAVAAAAADAAAVAAADAVAAAAADAAADADAAAAAAADAAAVAAADADIPWGTTRYWAIRNAVYDAIYAKTKARVEEQFGDIRDVTNRESIELLGLMIDPKSNEVTQ